MVGVNMVGAMFPKYNAARLTFVALPYGCKIVLGLPSEGW